MKRGWAKEYVQNFRGSVFLRNYGFYGIYSMVANSSRDHDIQHDQAVGSGSHRAYPCMYRQIGVKILYLMSEEEREDILLQQYA